MAKLCSARAGTEAPAAVSSFKSDCVTCYAFPLRRSAWRNPRALRRFEKSLPIAFLRAREATMRRFKPHVDAHGLTIQQWRVIRTLADGGPLDSNTLAARCVILPPSLTRIFRAPPRGRTDRCGPGALRRHGGHVGRDLSRNRRRVRNGADGAAARSADRASARQRSVGAREGTRRRAYCIGRPLIVIAPFETWISASRWSFPSPLRPYSSAKPV